MSERSSITTTDTLFNGIVTLVNKARKKVAVFLNTETALLYWSVGYFIQTELKQKGHIGYGKQIIATLSQQLTN